MERTGNGRFFAIINRISDLVILGLVFVLTSLPVVTLGASCTALYYSTAKTVRYEEGKPVKEYFRAWKLNLIQGCVSTVIYFALGGMLLCAVMMSRGRWTMLAVIFSCVILLSSFIYFFPVLSRFTVSVRACFQISVFLAVHYIKKTVLLLISLGLCAVLLYMNPYLLPLLAPFYALYATFIMEQVFKEYMVLTDEDAGKWFTR